MPYHKPFIKKTEFFIETGTYLGHGVENPLKSGFSKIFSIELESDLYRNCKDKFSKNENIDIRFGDSTVVLPQILSEYVGVPFTYWLDGHYSGEGTGLGLKECPLMEELEAILSRRVEGELIYVDDMRLYRNFNEDINEDRIYALLKKYIPTGTITYEPSQFDSKDILIIDY